VPPATFDAFFTGCATVAGALIGLLFVALSVSPQKLTGDDASAEHQVRAAAAFSALVNTLVVSLVALLPGASLGPVSLILAAAGLATTVGLIIVLFREHRDRIGRADVRLLAILVLLYVLQLVNGAQMGGSPHGTTGFSRLGGLAIGFFMFGIARSWQLVGARDVSLPGAVAEAIRRSHNQAHEGPDAAADTDGSGG
jgi:hypothetical protein